MGRAEACADIHHDSRQKLPGQPCWLHTKFTIGGTIIVIGSRVHFRSCITHAEAIRQKQEIGKSAKLRYEEAETGGMPVGKPSTAKQVEKKRVVGLKRRAHSVAAATIGLEIFKSLGAKSDS